MFGSPASGLTVEANNTTQLSGGTNTILHAESFHVFSGLHKVWTPETRLIFSPSQRCVVELEAAPTDSITFDMTVYVEEIGG
jgi:hypothetical protein